MELKLDFYKGRTLEIGERVKVYYNLNDHKFSIKNPRTGLVVAHADIVRLENVTFNVSEALRQKVIANKRKNVHAYVVGTFVGTDEGTEAKKAMYNPYKYETFVKADETPLTEANSVTCIHKQIRYE